MSYFTKISFIDSMQNIFVITSYFISLPAAMQSHTYMASFLFWCEFGYWEVAKSRSLPYLVHRRSLSAFVSIGRYMPTSLRLVCPRNTSCWERSTMIPLEMSQATFRIVEWPHKPTRVFLVCFVLTHSFQENPEVTHPEIALSQARLTVKFLWFGLPKSKCILLV